MTSDRPPRLTPIEVPVADLAAFAARASDAFGERHRSASVHRIFSRIRAAPGGPIMRGYCAQARRGCSTRPPASGRMSWLSCWPAGQRTTAGATRLVPGHLPSCARALDRDGPVPRGIEAEVVPPDVPRLGSGGGRGRRHPRGRHRRARRVGLQRLAYGCGLPAAAHTEDAVDAWVPGSEPCTSLRAVKDDGSVSSARKSARSGRPAGSSGSPARHATRPSS